MSASCHLLHLAPRHDPRDWHRPLFWGFTLPAGMTKAIEGTTKGLVTVVSTVGTGVKEVGKLFTEEGPDAFQQYNQTVSGGGGTHVIVKERGAEALCPPVPHASLTHKPTMDMRAPQNNSNIPSAPAAGSSHKCTS